MTVSEQHPSGFERDLTTKLKAALSDFVTVGLRAFAEYAKELHRREHHVDEASDDDKVVRAALLLEVDLDASADEIRAALRRKLWARGLHPDHGGDEKEASRLIAAKNLLIERLRDAA